MTFSALRLEDPASRPRTPAGREQEPDDDRPTASTGRAQPAVGPDVRRAIDGALAEAGGHAVAVAHLFLGLLRTPGSRAGQALAAHGVTRPATLGQMLGLAGRPAGDPA